MAEMASARTNMASARGGWGDPPPSSEGGGRSGAELSANMRAVGAQLLLVSATGRVQSRPCTGTAWVDDHLCDVDVGYAREICNLKY